ncbi:MAG: hypothetical protein Q7S92_05880 [Candidatus Diapherotrites archaeon]|nr:hypothetical protein [Candidatus Diapherotrites archaeon]
MTDEIEACSACEDTVDLCGPCRRDSEVDWDCDDEDFEINLSKLKKINNLKLTDNELHAKKNCMRGDFIEYLARKYYEKKGYHVVKLILQGGPSINIYNAKGVFNACNFVLRPDFAKELENIFSEEVAGAPDFICINKDEIKFVECKSDSDPEKFKSTQKEGFSSLLSQKYCIEIFSGKAEIDVKFKLEGTYKLEINDEEDD